MSLADHERLEVLQAFQETFGDRAGIVYEMMRPAENLVTKDDLTAAVAVLATKVELAEAFAGVATKKEMAEAFAGMATKAELAEAFAGVATKVELAELRTDLKTEMADLRVELKSEMADLRVELKSEISGGLQQQNRSLMFMIMGAVLLVILTNALQTALG